MLLLSANTLSSAARWAAEQVLCSKSLAHKERSCAKCAPRAGQAQAGFLLCCNKKECALHFPCRGMRDMHADCMAFLLRCSLLYKPCSCLLSVHPLSLPHLQENDSKRMRALKRAQDERKTREDKEKEAEALVRFIGLL